MCEIATFDRLAARDKHGGLSVREYAQLFRLTGLADLDRGLRVIDLGCGDGLMSCEIAKLGFRDVTGVDVSSGCIAGARRRAQAEGMDIDFRVDDIVDLTWAASASYDVAIVSGVLHHFPTFRAKCSVVTEVRRILRRRGLFAGLEPNRWNPYWYLPMLMMKLTWSRLPISFRYVKCNCTENEQNQLSPGELSRIFRHEGITKSTFDPFPYIKAEPGEKRYHEGMVALWREVMERFVSKPMPKPHNTSYFVFSACMGS